MPTDRGRQALRNGICSRRCGCSKARASMSRRRECAWPWLQRTTRGSGMHRPNTSFSSPSACSSPLGPAPSSPTPTTSSPSSGSSSSTGLDARSGRKRPWRRQKRPAPASPRFAPRISSVWAWPAKAASMMRSSGSPARVERMRAVDPEHFTTLNCEAWAWLGRGLPATAAEIAEKARQASASREWAVSVFWTNCTLVLAYSAMGRLDDARRALPHADATLHKQDQLSLWGAELQLAVAGGSQGDAVAAARPVEDLVPGWAWALERVFALQALVDLGAADQVDADLRDAPDTGFFAAVRIDLARTRGDHAEVLATAPAFIQLSTRVGAV